MILTKSFIFDKHLDFWQTFGFLTNSLIFAKHLDFSRNFRFLTKSMFIRLLLVHHITLPLFFLFSPCSPLAASFFEIIFYHQLFQAKTKCSIFIFTNFILFQLPLFCVCLYMPCVFSPCLRRNCCETIHELLFYARTSV